MDALARSERLEQARLAFEMMFTYANHVGLHAEEIGLTGEQRPVVSTRDDAVSGAVDVSAETHLGCVPSGLWQVTSS